MTTGATGQLGLALPVQGELSGTWGDTVNNGITQYTNIAIAATLTLTNDGAVTLANTTGDASATNITSSLTGAGTVTAQFAIVKVTGTLTTAKVITAPSYSKTYVVVNAATGGTVTFKASGQTGVSIAVGESAWVYYNGTDYVKIVGTATAGAAGGSNTQVQYNSSGSLAGSSNLTFNGTTLTAAGLSGPHDGTVGATTPNTGAFTTLSASSSVTLSGGTANGVTYLNGSKVLTSGSALTFDGTNFATTGNITSGGVLQALTTVQSSSGADLSLNANGANRDIIYKVNATELMRLVGSTGNLGIGTSSPAAVLNAYGATSYAGLNVQAVLSDSTALATGVGGILAFEGKYSGASLANYAAIGGLKENSTSGNYAGYLGFYTRANGSLPAEKARLDSAGYLSGVWADKVTALGNSGTATTITCTSGNVFTSTLTGNCTFTLSAPSTTTANTATSFTLILTNDGTAGRTVAFSGGTFKYPGGSVTRTTTANAVDIWFFFSPNGGTTWYVSIPMANLS